MTIMALLLLLVLSLWMHMKKQSSQSSATGGAFAFAKCPYTLAYWPLYLLLHRVCLVALDTLITAHLEKAVCLFFWSCCGVLTHCAARPFVSAEVGSLQFALLFSLVLVSGTSIVDAYRLAAAEEPTPGIKSVLKTVKTLQAVLLVLPLFYFVVFAWRKRRAIQGAAASCWSLSCQTIFCWCHWVQSTSAEPGEENSSASSTASTAAVEDLWGRMFGGEGVGSSVVSTRARNNWAAGSSGLLAGLLTENNQSVGSTLELSAEVRTGRGITTSSDADYNEL
jgi:hypothetical protein